MVCHKFSIYVYVSCDLCDVCRCDMVVYVECMDSNLCVLCGCDEWFMCLNAVRTCGTCSRGAYVMRHVICEHVVCVFICRYIYMYGLWYA